MNVKGTVTTVSRTTSSFLCQTSCGNGNHKNPTTVPMVTNPTEDNVTVACEGQKIHFQKSH